MYTWNEDQVLKSIEWLEANTDPRKTINRSIGSYGLKHVIEHRVGTYISNESVIEAMRRMGVKMSPIGDGTFYYFARSYEKARKAERQARKLNQSRIFW